MSDISESYPYTHPRDVDKVLRALALVICPKDVEDRARMDAVLAHSNLTMGAQPPLVRTAFATGVRTFNLGAIPRFGRPFTGLKVERAERYFLSWRDSKVALFHAFAKATKGMLALGYYEQPDVQARMGYTPDAWIAKVKKHRFNVFSNAIEAHEKALRTRDPLPSGHFNRPEAAQKTEDEERV